MKQKITLALFLLLLAGIGRPAAQGAASLPALVDQRVELFSILARLAEFPEYSSRVFKRYTDDVAAYFGPYKTHEAVTYLKKLRETNGIGYDAVMALAVHLDGNLELRVPFTAQIPDKRWGTTAALQMASLARQFATDARFGSFFTAHQGLYDTCQQRMQGIVDRVDLRWYDRFYGFKTETTFRAVIGLLNGGSNYGPKVVLNKKEDVYCIIGTWTLDSAGLPDYEKAAAAILPTIIHEFNHSYINPLVYKHQKDFKGSMDTVFGYVREDMKKLAYEQSVVMLLESLVRAAVNRYLLEHTDTALEYTANRLGDRNRGFIWMDELVGVLGTYEQNRSRYKNLKRFFPEVVSYYADLANRMPQLKRETDSRYNQLVKLEGLQNGSVEVDTALKELKLYFLRPVDPKVKYGFGYGPGGKAHYPLAQRGALSPDGKYLTVPLTLKEDWAYEFVISEDLYSYVNPDYPLRPVTIRFKTKKY